MWVEFNEQENEKKIFLTAIIVCLFCICIGKPTSIFSDRVFIQVTVPLAFEGLKILPLD